MTFDTRAFRDALGCFPTGVAVVTALGTGRHMAITVNSFGSLSLDPPLVLWCLEKRSNRYEAFTKAEGFTISVLGADHREVSSALAYQGEHRLEDIQMIPTELGPPAIVNALAVFECAREAVHAEGDHAIIVGRVLRFARLQSGHPLVFFRGAYSALVSGS
jgi:flavin reductase (DIM6/NTAB) family NADH-FMN oxidoreductase RutF